MVSLLGRLAPLALRLRGSKRMFTDPQRTLDRIAYLTEHPQDFTPPSSLDREVRITRREFDGWTVYDVSPLDEAGIAASTPKNRAVYLHGGCYCFEITAFHWKLIAQLVRDSGTTITVPIMPLAPQGTASVVVDKVATLTQSLIADVGAAHVSVLGDSSGGGLALATAMAVRDRHPEPLRSINLMAPWLDVRGTDPMLQKIAPSDPWLAVPGTKAAGALYRAELEETDWRVSPLFGDFTGLGPITVISGTRDIVYADALRMIPTARAAGVQVNTIVGEGMIHVYPLLPLRESAPARDAMARAIS